MKNSKGLSIKQAVKFLISEKAMCNLAYRFTLASERAICFKVNYILVHKSEHMFSKVSFI